ncbi:hypothetical protein C8R44DRAFT_754521 [Mycena epipterygia]|nr:hypothetical protein C8R44DRAFT_754521 [Mycena epipterygia]
MTVVEVTSIGVQAIVGGGTSPAIVESCIPTPVQRENVPGSGSFTSALQRSCAGDHSLAKSPVLSYDLRSVINFKFPRARVFPLYDLTIIKFRPMKSSKIEPDAFTVRASSKRRDVRPSTILKDSVRPGIAINHVAGAKPRIDSISGHRKKCQSCDTEDTASQTRRLPLNIVWVLGAPELKIVPFDPRNMSLSSLVKQPRHNAEMNVGKRAGKTVMMSEFFGFQA